MECRASEESERERAECLNGEECLNGAGSIKQYKDVSLNKLSIWLVFVCCVVFVHSNLHFTHLRSLSTTERISLTLFSSPSFLSRHPPSPHSLSPPLLPPRSVHLHSPQLHRASKRESCLPGTTSVSSHHPPPLSLEGACLGREGGGGGGGERVRPGR